MNISQLRAFVAVAEHGSFSAAARSLGISQPAVTMQVRGLEADLGTTLLDRRYRVNEPTESGRALLTHARLILAQIEEARDEIDRMSDHVGGHLHIAASTTPGQYLMPRLLGGFLDRNPEVGVTLTIADSTEVAAAVDAGRAALGMTGAEVRTARSASEPAGSDEVVLIAPPGHPATRSASAADLARCRFIMREGGSGTRLVAEEALRGAGLEPDELDTALELGTNEAIVNAVEAGLGIGPVSRWAADKALELGTVEIVPAKGFPVRRPFFVVVPRGPLSRAAEAFVAHLREELQ